jgi:hypothetical protein
VHCGWGVVPAAGARGSPGTAASGNTGGGRGGAVEVLAGLEPGAGALGCLLEYGIHWAGTADGIRKTYWTWPPECWPSGETRTVATADGVYLLDLLEHAPDFTAVHREDLFGLSDNGRPSLAATWLR